MADKKLRIGIIVHSQTGNTLSIARKLCDRLKAAGHTAIVERVVAVKDDEMNTSKISFKEAPDTKAYDTLVFAAPVRAFSLSPVLKAYLLGLKGLEGRHAACYVTQGFPFPWMGGNRAIKQMKSICETKGLSICGTGIVNWSSKKRESMITELIEQLSECFK